MGSLREGKETGVYTVMSGPQIPLLRGHMVSWLEERDQTMGYAGIIEGYCIWFPAEPAYDLDQDPDLVFDEVARVYVWCGASAERFLPRIPYRPRMAAA